MAEAVFILGAPRSGSGTLAALARQAGVFLGDQLIPPRPGFPRALFEDRRVVAINQDLLAAFDLGASPGLPLPEGWQQTPAGRLALFRAAELAADLGVAGVFGLKDPRLAVALPLWLAALREKEIPARAVIAVRDPLDPALRQEPAEEPRRILLWLAQTVLLLGATAGLPRIFVDFQEILAGPVALAGRLRRFSGLGDSLRPRDPQAIHALVAPEAARSTLPGAPRSRIEQLAQELAGLMRAGNAPALAGFLSEGEGMLLAGMQAEAARALQAAGRGPLEALR